MPFLRFGSVIHHGRKGSLGPDAVSLSGLPRQCPVSLLPANTDRHRQVRRRVAPDLTPYVCLSAPRVRLRQCFPGTPSPPTLAAGLVWGALSALTTTSCFSAIVVSLGSCPAFPPCTRPPAVARQAPRMGRRCTCGCFLLVRFLRRRAIRASGPCGSCWAGWRRPDRTLVA